MGLKWYLVLVMAAWFLSCAGTGPEKSDSGKVDSRISSNAHKAKAVGYSDLYLDNAPIERFIREHKVDEKKAADLRDFYSNRNYQFAWFAADGLDEHGRAFWNLHNNYVNYAQDSSFFNKRLHQQMEVLVNDADDAALPADEIRELELALTEHFFDYANYAFTGKIDPRELKWHIPQKKIKAVALLDSLIARNGEDLHE